MLKKRNGILRKNMVEGFEKSYVPLHGVEGVNNYQNHPYIINEWPLNVSSLAQPLHRRYLLKLINIKSFNQIKNYMGK
jgi:hypothetical protein